MIKVENLTFSYPSSYDPIFENVSFQIDTDWKLGFVGRNGRGKTTFLNLLMDQYEYRGKIIKSVRFDYFPYLVKDTKKWTMEVLNEVCPQAEEWQIRKELYALEVDEEVLWRPFETLSNGEQTKVLLAALFLNEGHFLLIDEPTNHLDTHGRQIVSEYLRKKKGFILVSHDRCFLDGCVDHILSLNRSNIEVQSGTFSAFLQNFEQQQRLEEAQNESLKKDIRRLSQSAKRTQGWSDRVEASKTGETCQVDRGKTAKSNRAEVRSFEKQGAGRGVKTASVAIPFGYTGYVFGCGSLLWGKSGQLSGVLFNPSRRTGGIGWKQRKWEKQPAQIRGGRSFGAYRDDYDGIWARHFLCTAGYVTFAGDTFGFCEKEPDRGSFIQSNPAETGF